MSLEDIMAGAFPFMLLLLLGLGLVMVFPGLITWLPSTMS
jgi:TRAP-type mannitol/chloroaromatic compound transport system permease large subunit